MFCLIIVGTCFGNYFWPFIVEMMITAAVDEGIEDDLGHIHHGMVYCCILFDCSVSRVSNQEKICL